MNKVELKIKIGENLDEVIKKLRYLKSSIEGDYEFYCMFDDIYISSLMSDDEIYKKVGCTTHTENESNEIFRKAHERCLKPGDDYEEKLPYLIEYYKESGKDLIRKDRYTEWEKVVPIRLDDIYHGLDLASTLDICKIMNDKSLDISDRIKQSVKEFDNQNHSGLSAYVVRSLIARFCPDGEILSESLK